MTRSLRLFFRLLYHEMAWTYDLVAALVSAGKWQDWVASVLPYLHGPQILELGHGPGHLQDALWERSCRPVGLDASTQMGRQAYRRLVRKHFSPRLVNGYAQEMPFASASFDQVVATFPTEYIVSSTALSEIRRVLKPEGELIVLPVAWVTGRGVWDRLAAGLFRITGQAPAWDERFTYPLREAGFAIQIEEIQLPASTLLILRMRRASAHSGPRIDELDL